MSEQKWDNFIPESLKCTEEWRVNKEVDTLNQRGLVKHFLKFPQKMKNNF